jgi:predicted tellurium resistance membrane protein TerC
MPGRFGPPLHAVLPIWYGLRPSAARRGRRAAAVGSAEERSEVDWITDGEIWVALLTLTSLEIVLGIDNVIFISILAGKLPPEQRDRARVLGLAAALITRILLLFSINWIADLTDPWFAILDHDFSGRDLILIGGGLFLLGKSTFEIHEKLEVVEHAAAPTTRRAASFAGVIIQIMLLDIVFSLDSVITAVGMADDLGVMVAAVVIAVGVMLVASGPISAFVDQHPTVKMLALSFLLLIGMSLVAEGWHFHIPKGYIYAAMAFSVFVELLNLRLRAKSEHPVHLPRLNESFAPEDCRSVPPTFLPVPQPATAATGTGRQASPGG